MPVWVVQASGGGQLAAFLLVFVAGCLTGGMLYRRFHAARERRSALHELERLRIMFEDAIAAIDDGFVLYDEADRMYICNDAFRNQFGSSQSILSEGLTYEEQIEKLARSGIVPGIEGKEEDFVRGLMEKRHSEFGLTKVFQTHDGRWIRQRDKKTSAGNVVGLRTDITELKERELELEEARQQAEAAAEAKTAFLANMSHEIRTPMNGVIGMAELLEETDLNEEQRMCTKTVVESSNALLSLVNDVLDFSKADAGKMTVNKAPFDLVECLYSTATLLAPNASEKSIEICLDIPDDQPCWCLGDQGRLRQVLINLVGNAIKFTETGFVLIKLEVNTESDQMRFLVQDTGIGIPASKVDTIFDVFEQVNSETTRRYDGAGLGLAISKKLIELMGGTLGVTSKLGEGSEFTFALPLESCEPVEEPRVSLEQELPQGIRVLVVDDLEVNRLILQKTLTSWQAQVVLAENGPHALECLEKEEPFDLAILDFQMPGMDGNMLLERFREHPSAQNMPVVLLSSVDAGLDSGKTKGLGFAASLLKPMRAARLKQVLLGIFSTPSAGGSVCNERKSLDDYDLHGVRILVAEDNRTNQLVIRKMIEKHGAEVEICANGQAAVESFAQSPPDLVLMDVSMPEMNGYEATRRIREGETLAQQPPVPILALTANATPKDREKCLQSGMTDFLSKPVRKAVVLQKIEEYLAAKVSMNGHQKSDANLPEGPKTCCENQATPSAVNLR